MATFCYRTIYCLEPGQLVEMQFPCGQAPDMVVTDGCEPAIRSIADEHGGGMPSGGKGWPLKSDSAGVHPAQRQEAYEESVKLGAPTDFDRLGRAVFTDRQHRANYLKAKGMFDKDGGYAETYNR